MRNEKEEVVIMNLLKKDPQIELKIADLCRSDLIIKKQSA